MAHDSMRFASFSFLLVGRGVERFGVAFCPEKRPNLPEIGWFSSREGL